VGRFSEDLLYSKVISSGDGLTCRWKIFVDYLSSTVESGFNQSLLTQYLYNFELKWQVEKWGLSEDELWSPTGDLLDILGQVKNKWREIFSEES
jgi:hypothetical protein